MRRHIGYLLYVLRHKWFVLKAGLHLKVPIMQLLLHDMSKFSWHEWSAYAKANIDDDGYTKHVLKTPEYLAAWNHHQKHNPHHWQYWVLFNGHNTNFLEIPERYLREMVADWSAVSWSQLKQAKPAQVSRSWPNMTDALNDAHQWYVAHTGIRLHPSTRNKLEQIFTEHGVQ